MAEYLQRNQNTRYANKHTWCLAQPRINWEGCDRKGFWGENLGDDGGGAQIIWMGASIRIIGTSACVTFTYKPVWTQMLARSN